MAVSAARSTKTLLHKKQALDLRVRGKSYNEIAKELGLSKRGAWLSVQAGIRDWATPTADEVLQLECARLDKAVAAVMPKVEAGDLQAVDRLTRLVTVRASLFGLTPNVKIEMVGGALDAYVTAQGWAIADVLGVLRSAMSGSTDPALLGPGRDESAVVVDVTPTEAAVESVAVEVEERTVTAPTNTQASPVR